MDDKRIACSECGKEVIYYISNMDGSHPICFVCYDEIMY